MLQNASPAKSNLNAKNQSNVQKSPNDFLEDLFSSTESPASSPADDFNPRASDVTTATSAGEFGDFASAFGGTNPSPSKKASSDEFADFSGAFTGAPVSSSVASNAANSNGNQSNADLLMGLGGFDSLSMNNAQPSLLGYNQNFNNVPGEFLFKYFLIHFCINTCTSCGL